MLKARFFTPVRPGAALAKAFGTPTTNFVPPGERRVVGVVQSPGDDALQVSSTPAR
jgi:hypothetical protein